MRSGYWIYIKYMVIFQEWRSLVQQHDIDGDGKLAADELLTVAEFLTNKHVRNKALNN